MNLSRLAPAVLLTGLGAWLIYSGMTMHPGDAMFAAIPRRFGICVVGLALLVPGLVMVAKLFRRPTTNTVGATTGRHRCPQCGLEHDDPRG